MSTDLYHYKTLAGHGRALSIPEPFYINAAIATVGAIVESDGKNVSEAILQSCEEDLKALERTIFGLLAFHCGAFKSHGPGKSGDTQRVFTRLKVSFPLHRTTAKEKHNGRASGMLYSE